MPGQELVLGRVLSVRTGCSERHERPDWDHVQSQWRTAYWKAERSGPVHVGTLGLAGDEQADTAHHGGPHMAVLMYAASHYTHWRTLAGLEGMAAGGFAENLTVSDLDETQACVGDVLAVGGVRLQISSPRGPCTDISRRWNASWLLKRVIELRRTGWYLRVLRAGELAQDDEIRLVERPHAGWTIERLLRLRYTPPREPAELAQAAALTALAPEWRTLYDRLPSGETD